MESISTFFASNVSSILPVAILLVSFMIKLSVDRSVKLPNIVASSFELPVDVMIIAITVISTVIISHPDKKQAIVFLTLYFVIIIASAICWRKSIEFLEENTGKGNKTAFIMSAISFAVSSVCLLMAVSMVGDVGGVKEAVE